MSSHNIETRAAKELRVSSTGKLVGYAAVFNAESKDLGNFTESIKPGAFSRSLEQPEDILALYDHDQRSVLGRVGAGTLKLAEDERGLKFEINLPPTTIGRDLGILVERGDVHGASFAFNVPENGDYWTERNGKPHRELRDVQLHEITVTSNPAYQDTEVLKRVHSISRIHASATNKNSESPVRLFNLKRFLETV